ncbi:MAG: Sodium:alanine symporter family protein [Candidatus Methanofastidiosum methylothiophilum]|uniref:Sodium:alanine symporter family protein n=1 Tax=Candidatus Methanofastidiosum methylothiophilum TaxID=1705564 RepID=A0A150IPV2_9EURY|nr:MAG: Sodium:alanine symporter family protein [Candidatus Methanofastidiosum methylthiophilus]KYC46997.1 MAG: Sodium:alanine symporter family protein [Candidatus Methanofastidiosum methylthiophilus]KYC49386.1 MAG: Sodium:alanine symporter family protein [Candidatus Methanofastidiosum methylthiophilus]
MSVLEIISDLVGTLDSIIWGPVMLVLLVGTGIYLTVILRGIQFRRLILSIKNLLESAFKKEDLQGDIPSFQALTTALSATVGTGNIAGVATAIVMGGPGALFWMWVTSIVGMATKFSEVVLGVKYREKNPDGEYSGGPMYYIQKGFKERYNIDAKILAVLFSVFGVIASFGIGSMAQANSVILAIISNVGKGGSISVPVFGEIFIASAILGGVLVILTALVIFGGIKRIGEVTSYLVPFMSIMYILAALVIILIHFDRILYAFGSVIGYAFSPTAFTGGVAGFAVSRAIRFGIARGVFSNEAGLGSAPIAHAAAKTPHPVRQGTLAIVEVFIDTIILCSMTGFVILESNLDIWGGNLTSSALTSAAFAQTLGIFGTIVIVLCSILFGYSTILGWSYYGEKCFEYLFGVKRKYLYKLVFLFTVFFGSITYVDIVWNISDMFNGLMAIPNLIALVALGGIVVDEVRKYFK